MTHAKSYINVCINIKSMDGENSMLTDIIIFTISLVVLGIVLYMFIDFMLIKNKISDSFGSSITSPPPPPPKTTTSSVPAAASTTTTSETVAKTTTGTTTTQDKIANNSIVKSEYDAMLSRFPKLNNTSLPNLNVPVDTFYQLMIVMDDAIRNVKTNIYTISRAMFYQQSILTLLANYPFFRSFMVFASFVYNTPGVNQQTIHDALIRLYDSEKSPQLYVDVNGLKYYVILEFNNIFDVYERNASLVDKYLGK